MSQTRIRRAERDDAAAIAALSAELGYVVTAAEVLERLSRLPVTDRVLVAELDGRVVGWVHMSVYRTLVDRPSVGIFGLVVSESVRRRGIGRLLMECADDLARAYGLTKIVLRSNVIREEAHRFYERIGYTQSKRQAVFVRSIEPPRGRAGVRTAEARAPETRAPEPPASEPRTADARTGDASTAGKA